MTKLQGINFRATSGYVTDGTGDTYDILDTAEYPRTTPQGVTVGWEQSIGFSRDRASTNDPRLAGSATCSTSINGGVQNFRIDLDAAGSHDITLAAGDAAYFGHVKVELFDTTTSLGVLIPAGTTSGGNKYKDATGTEYSNTAWPASNTAVTKVFSSTICRVRVGDGTNACVIAHVAVTTAAGGGGGTTQNVTFSTATMHLNGNSLGVNAKSQLAMAIATMSFVGNSLGVNAKSMLSFATATMTLRGQSFSVNAKSLIAFAIATMTLSGLAMTASGTTLITIAQTVLRFVGNTPVVINGVIIERILALLGVGS